MNTASKVLVGIAVVVIVVGVAVGGWLGGWWLSEESTNRRARIDNDSYARQSALSDEMLQKQRDIRDIDVQLTTAEPDQQAPLKAQRTAIVNQFCDAYAQSNNPPAEVGSTANEEC